MKLFSLGVDMCAEERASKYRPLIEKLIEEERPKREIAQQLNIQQATLDSYLKILGIQYKGQQNKKGQQKGPNKYRPALYYIENNIPISGYELLRRLIKDGLKDRKCERCGITEWLGLVDNLVLELNHKDSNHYNNVLDNLEVLCPNCHALHTRVNNKNRKHTPQ